MADQKSIGLFHGQTFFLRPCSVRSEIRKLIQESGGIFSKEMQKGTIRLTDDKKHTLGYHIDYIYDSLNKDALQDLEHYKLPKYGCPGYTNTLVKVDRMVKGRQHYEPEEDDAIMMYVMKYGMECGSTGSISGNVLWKEMEREKVTFHTWQSMKARYLKHLQQRQPSFDFQPLTFRVTGGKTVPFANNQPTNRVTDNKANETTLSQADNNRSRKGKRKMFSTKHQEVFSDSPRNDEKQLSTDHGDNTEEQIVPSNQSIDLFQLVSSSDSKDSESDEPVVCLVDSEIGTSEELRRLSYKIDSPRKSINRKQGGTNKPSELNEDSINSCNELPSKKSKDVVTEDREDEDSFDANLIEQAQESDRDSSSLVESECECNSPEDRQQRLPKNNVIMAPLNHIPCKCYTNPLFGDTIKLLRKIEQLSSDDEIWKDLVEEFMDENVFDR